ncbi:MAG: phosphoribosylanthranilate isomerase [Cyclobacteriaceae bacterium]|jgi:phosphoribosylanthranilate isomerase|nr:phosphoribosylanthranilate isomerase [Flammeovirgaceae bacterium]
MKELAVKVCGMRDTENIRSVAQLPVDFLGFIFYAQSPRFVGDHFAMPTDLPESVRKVGVFVNERTEIILSHVQQYDLDFVQLHGNESVAQCEELFQLNVRVIKAFSVDDKFDFSTTVPFERFVNYFLFDTKGKNFGGNGVTFDWNILRKYQQRVPFFLSGGLNESNVTDLSQLKDLNVFAIDINSGVELEPGKKSVDKIAAVISKINSIIK